MGQYLPIYGRQLANHTLGSNTAGFFFSSGVTWVDFVVANWFETMNNLHANEWAQWKVLEDYRKRVYALPKIAEYIKTRPTSVM